MRKQLRNWVRLIGFFGSILGLILIIDQTAFAQALLKDTAAKDVETPTAKYENLTPLDTHKYDALEAAAVYAMKRNIEDARRLFKASPGAVPASTGEAHDGFNGEHQDYRFTWRRDSAFIALALVDVYKQAVDPNLKSWCRQFLFDYAEFNLKLLAQAPNDEPKFYLNGKMFKKIWGRPQSDGPALTAMAMAEFADILINEGHVTAARRLFDQLITGDLDSIAGDRHRPPSFNRPSFDIWEEQLGFHFATLVLQDNALVMGVHVARRLKLSVPTNWLNTIQAIDRWLPEFIDPSAGKIVATQSASGQRYNNGREGFDSVVYIAPLYIRSDIRATLGFQQFSFTASSPWMMATVEKFRQKFMSGEEEDLGEGKKGGFKYYLPINQKNSRFLVGRYPKDKYFGGNVWPIPTFDLGRDVYAMAIDAHRKGFFDVENENLNALRRFTGQATALKPGSKIAANSAEFQSIARNMLAEGDSLIDGMIAQAGGFDPRKPLDQQLYLNEQYDKHNGAPAALPNLTWNYAELYQAIQSRKRLVEILQSSESPNRASLAQASCASILTAGANASRATSARP